MTNILDKTYRENQNTHFMLNNPPPKNCVIYELIWEKCDRATQADTATTKNYDCCESVFPRGNYSCFGDWTECCVKA